MKLVDISNQNAKKKCTTKHVLHYKRIPLIFSKIIRIILLYFLTGVEDEEYRELIENYGKVWELVKTHLSVFGKNNSAIYSFEM